MHSKVIDIVREYAKRIVLLLIATLIIIIEIMSIHMIGNIKQSAYITRLKSQNNSKNRYHSNKTNKSIDTVVSKTNDVNSNSINDTTNKDLIIENKKLDKYQSNIRVVLKTNGYSGIKHKRAILESSKGVVITYSNNKKQVCNNNVTINSKSNYFKDREKITIEPIDESQGIYIKTIKRNSKEIKYYGSIDIYKENNKIVIVNDVDIEHYLYSVVPSEMPISFGLEALKVQAICARTYAYSNLKNNTYKKYNAHVDDSVSYQVYNNQTYSDIIKKAVDETCSKVLVVDNKNNDRYELAKVFYYSTSCGYSSNTKEVFGGSNMLHMNSKKQCVKKEGTNKYIKGSNIKKDKDFKKFILSTGGDCFEKNCEWFRWKITWNVDKISKAVNTNLSKICGNKKNSYVKVYKNKRYVSCIVKDVGKIIDIRINQRGEGGVVKELIINGSKEKIKIKSQYVIRQILAPTNISVVKSNNKKVEGMGTLPSGYFMIEKSKKGNFNIYGGGYGHGVGMSQYGVYELTKLNMDYDEIINYYFNNVSIININNK